jgi:NAD(P)-dependent dehydrogenase (short-subunit alcohol dehydrogenase family)
MSRGFQDKVVIITGSNRGIGKAIATDLLRHGAKVVLNGRNQARLANTEKEMRAISQDILAVCADISQPDQAKQVVEKTIETFGKLDILINNAAVSMRGRFADLNTEVFRSVFDINVQGTANITIPSLPHIRDTRGSVVFISSLAAIRGIPYQSAYCSSKMALTGIAEALRAEEKAHNVHVGLILVGITENEKDKKVLSPNGSPMELREEHIIRIKEHSFQSVSNAVLRNIRKRRYKTTLTGIGKALALFQRFLPGLVYRLLVLSLKSNIRRIHGI